MSGVQVPGDDVSVERDESPEKQKVELEILHGVFDQDKSPAIKNAVPEQITTNKENYTTVFRRTVSTIYDPEGKVEASIPKKYLLARAEAGGKDVPVVIGNIDSEESYILMPSGQKACPKMPPFIPRYNVFKKNDLTMPSDVVGFLLNKGFFRKPEGFDFNTYLVPPENPNQKWQKLIQTGKIKFIDEEKVAKFALSVRSPSLDLATEDIKRQVKTASWIVDFPQKQSLFVYEGKLRLFDWSDGVANNWSITEFELPTRMSYGITAAGVDPRDNFLLVGSGHKLFVFDHHKKPMEVVFELANPNAEFDGQISLREDGSILVGDKNGRLTSIISNLHTFVSRKERLEQERTLQRLRAKKRGKVKAAGGEAPAVLPEVQEISNEIAGQFAADIAAAASLETIESLRAELRKSKKEYETDIKDSKLIDSIFKPIFDSLTEKENEILSAKIDREMVAIRGLVGRIEGMSLADLAQARMRVDRVKAQVMSSGLDVAIKTEITDLSDTFSERAAEVLGKDEEKLLTQLDGLFSAAKQKLTAISKFSEFEVWQNTDYPTFLDALAGQMRIVPASHTKVIGKLREMEESMRNLKKQYNDKFKEQYEEVRQQASERIDIMIGLASDRLTEFLETFGKEVQKKSFRTPEEAKQWVERSPLYASALTVLDDLEAHDPEKANELKQKMKVEAAQLAFEVKRLKDATVDTTTGRQMAIFGNVAFPVWEHKVEGKRNVKIELTYKVDNASKGPGIKPDDYMCELFYKVTDENGKVHEIPMHAEDTRKYGRVDERLYKGRAYFPSYTTVGHARKMIAAIKAKESQKASEVTRRDNEFQETLRELIKQRKRDEHAESRRQYLDFIHENGLYGWYALKAFRNQYHNGEDTESAAGQGRIPDWAPYWIVDDATDKALGIFAYTAKMSLNLREGIISLEGHAGTGKDVLVQMFAHKTKRPLYSFDCTKWTTEFDLSQDVSLAAEEGASFTVKEDSVIVKALETPGAILYFNEFNAMPEQAQIFLHSLFDAKRQITLKTSSGRIVKAHPSVIICSSMNPGYPGTIHPQQATRSRMIPIKLAFPEFKKQDGTFASDEALRIARSVKSLQDLTYNPDMEENEFAKLWNGYINKGSTNGNLTPERKFDMEVIFALITFATQIREGFINKIAKRGGRKTFTISQPFTLREMRRCAYMLSSMDPAKKQNPDNAETIAKDLVRQFYSQYIFDEKESEELETNLAQWTSQKPMRTGPAAGTGTP